MVVVRYRNTKSDWCLLIGLLPDEVERLMHGDVVVGRVQKSDIDANVAVYCPDKQHWDEHMVLNCLHNDPDAEFKGIDLLMLNPSSEQLTDPDTRLIGKCDHPEVDLLLVCRGNSERDIIAACWPDHVDRYFDADGNYIE